MIQNVAELELAVRELSQKKVIAFDTEFIRETTFFPQLEIIQLATEDQVWILDVQAFKKDLRSLQPLVEIMRNPNILKVIHAAQADQECLYTTFQCVATSTLDTALAASLCGYGDQQGLGNLLKSVLGIQLKKGHARTNWAVRPLPAQLIEYAEADVRHLVELGEKLLEQLDQLGRRQWALDLSTKWEDVSIYDPAPEVIAAKVDARGSLDSRGFGSLIELVRWREGRVKQLNRPRKWIADDGILLNLAQVHPKDLEHLKAFRGLQAGEIQKSGETILEAIWRGRENPVERTNGSVAGEIGKPPSARESQVLALVQCYVGILADQNKVAVRHLAMSQQLLQLIRTPVASAKEWVERGLLSPSAGQLIGQDLLDFLHGRKSLILHQGREVRIHSQS